MENLKKFLSMRWMLMFVTAMVLSVSLTACGDDDDDDDDLTGGIRPLTGSWIGTDRYGESIYVFDEDGSGYYQELPNGRVDRFTDYMVKDHELLIRWVGDDDYDDEGEIRLGADKFDLRWDDDEPWITFVKH